ncbi:MAG: alpha-galactosidase [Bacteroidales bacterium]|nr:alpha-galactosidase [Bacteroidales bacterium]MCF8389335.1 alpha-galactosidase [Bacteroidales bacterium]
MKNPKRNSGNIRKFSLLMVAILALVFYSCNTPKQEIKVDVVSNSGTSVLQTDVKVSEMKDGSGLLSISFTNKGEEAEMIKEIRINIQPSNESNTESRFLYGGHDMGRTPIQHVGYDDEQLSSGAFLLIKHNEESYSKTGILSWNIFRPYITFSKEEGIIITADGENKPVLPGETISFEKIVLEEGANWQDMLYAYGEQIAEVQDIKTKEIKQFKGWSTWDYYGRNYNSDDIKQNVEMLKISGLDANLIQIDGGWWTQRGDYLSVKEELPEGMNGIAEYIKSNGYLAGIHLDGFRADKKANVYKEHPDWFLRDQNGETICQEIGKGIDFMEYIYFDYSNPDVRDYMKNVLTTIREEWGFGYFKIDFIRYGLLDDVLKIHEKEGLTEIQGFDPSITSMERTRAGLKAMREGIGEAFFLGCSSVFGPTFGLVDGLRTGGDISPRIDFYQTRCLQNGGNFYLNKTIVQNDADYLVLRNKDDEEAERAWGKHKFGGDVSLEEAKMWTDYVSLFGGIKISSDNLITLREERKELIRDAFSLKSCDRFIPLDLWDHAKDNGDAFNIMLGENEDGIYLALFNWDTADQEFMLEGFPVSIKTLQNISDDSEYQLSQGSLTIKLQTHTSMILKIDDGSNFDELRKVVKLKINN